MTPRSILYSVKRKKKEKKAQRATIAHLRASMSQNILNTSKVSELFFQTVKGSYLCSQGWDKYCPAGKFHRKMPEIAGTANTLKITEFANTGIYEHNSVNDTQKGFFMC